MKKLLLSLLSYAYILTVTDAFTGSLPLRPKSTLFVSAQELADRVEIQEGAPRDISTMEQWAAACGVQRADGFQLYVTNEGNENDKEANVGAMTTQSIPANAPVLYVPNNVILSAQQAQQELGRLQTAEYLLTRTQEADHILQFYLMLKILKEYEMGSQSPYYHWFNSLPRYYSNGAAMTQFCCSQCLPPLVGKLASQERVRFSKFFQALRQVPFLSDQVKRNRQLTKWAYQVVCTRSLPVYNDIKIAPMADYFNHGTQTEILINYDEQGNCYAYFTYDIPPGSPLRVSYGDPTNPSYLFARYGFLDESSQATYCKIMIDNPTQPLLDLGYDPSRMLFFKDTGGVSQEVYDVLLYQLLPPDQQQMFHQAHLNNDLETKQSYHQHYYPQTAEALRNHIDTFLQQLDILSEKAVARMRTKAKKHPRLPLILKHNEFVKQTFLSDSSYRITIFIMYLFAWVKCVASLLATGTSS